ncbi:hypothetical protein ABIB25_000222 [Nakamurella sp. UYEF19]|uniref:sugar-binding protein n=1 Tax=Nakamurella sp. UYEF19 TaxID=1756392 RepID=UPI0033930DA3
MQGLWRATPYTVGFTLSDGESKTISGTTAFAPVYPDGSPGMLTVDLANQAQYVDLGGGTSGGDDLSGTMTLTYDATYLKVRATIHDDVHSPAADALNLWSADSIQFAFASGLPAPGGAYSEFGAALLGSGPALYQFSPVGGSVAGGQVSVVRDEARRTTVYSVQIPWAAAGLSPGDPYFSYSFLVNDSDGSGRKGFIQWGAGIGASKESAKYLPVQRMP